MTDRIRTPRLQRSATIQDVARAAGVSTATVSRALSNPGLLSDRTRALVLDAIRTTGYRVNRAARNLRMQRAGAVLVLVPDLGKPFYSRILAGISAGFADSEYAVLIADTVSRPLGQGALEGYFLDGRIDGVISLDGGLDPAALAACAEIGVGGRIVFLCEWVEGSGLPVIRSDNAEGARLAIRHLHGLGHRRIAHVTGPEGNVLTAARLAGVLEERARLALHAPEDSIIRGDFSLEAGAAAAERILAMNNRPTAVFCAADMTAFGLIAGLAAGGLRVPDDISVMGFDDIDMAAYSVPALTTIRQDRRRLGLVAAKALRRRLRAEAVTGEDDMIEVALVRRASTAPPLP